MARLTRSGPDPAAFVRGVAAEVLRVPALAAPRVAAAVRAETVKDRLAGRDNRGQAMPPRKRPRRDGNNGPPMSPRGESSWPVAALSVVVTVNAASAVISVTHTGEAGRLADYHGEGKVRGAPVRDVRGLSPAALAAADLAVEATLRDVDTAISRY